MSVSKDIKQVGLTRLARAMNVPKSTVQHWQETNAVPVWRVAAYTAAMHRLLKDEASI